MTRPMKIFNKLDDDDDDLADDESTICVFYLVYIPKSFLEATFNEMLSEYIGMITSELLIKHSTQTLLLKFKILCYRNLIVIVFTFR